MFARREGKAVREDDRKWKGTSFHLGEQWATSEEFAKFLLFFVLTFISSSMDFLPSQVTKEH